MTDITWKNERRKLHQLMPWPRNPRYIKTDQAERLVSSVEDFGQVETLAIGPDDALYNGHQRLNVLAGQYGMDYEVDVRVSSRPLTEKERERLTILLHKGAAGNFDWEILANEFEFDDLLEWGFSEDELFGHDFDPSPEENVGADTEPQINRADELREEWGTELGQMWACGEHRLLIADCTDADAVARLMGGEKAELVFTDPPYNIASENEVFAANVSQSMSDLKSADWDKDFDLRPSLDSRLGAMAADCTVYVCTSHHLSHIVWSWMKEWSAHHEWCAWHKPNPMPSLSKRHWTWDGELIPYATRGKHTFNFPDEGHAPSIWRIPKSKDTDHPTEKAVGVPEMAISHSSKIGSAIFDPFAGSGTTGIACHNLGRKARMIEISPAYGAVILQRMKEHTGVTPELI